MLHLVCPSTRTHRYNSCDMFSQTEGRPRGWGGHTDIVLAVASLSLLCPFECTFQKSYLGLDTLGFGLVCLGCPWGKCTKFTRQTETMTGDAECLKRCIVNLCMYERVYVCVCALKLLQNGGPNGGKIAAK